MSIITLPQSVITCYGRRPLPRGIRNNNPGNIRIGDPWMGLCAMQEDGSFCQFIDIKYGLRALAYVLRFAYYNRRQLHTVRAIISCWAPPTENDTEAYIAAVCSSMQVTDDQPLDLYINGQLSDLMCGIIKHENGSMPYTVQDILAGIQLLSGAK